MSKSIPTLFAINDRFEDTNGSDQDDKDENEDEEQEARLVMSELERLHVQYDAIKLAMQGRLYNAPIETGMKHLNVLESAIGPGIWAIDLARSKGTDCNVRLHTTDNGTLLPLPPNCIIQDDPIPAKSFDLVYARGLVAARMATPEHISSLVCSLRDGGYLELVDIETRLFEQDQAIPSATSQWAERLSTLEGNTDVHEILASESKRTQRPIRIVSTANTILPLGEWSDDPNQRHIGQMLKSSFLSFFNNVSAPIAIEHFGWDQSDIALNQYQIRSEWESTPPRKFYFNMRITIAQVAGST